MSSIGYILKMDGKSESIALPSLSLAITFLLIGLTFAIPAALIPNSDIQHMSKNMSVEIGNVYAVVAWCGLAHFFYAYRGQVFSLKALGARSFTGYILVAIICLAALFAVRSLFSFGLFQAITWTYFILHFYKAEAYFEGQSPRANGWRDPLKVVVTFAWLTVVLLNPGGIITQQWVIWLFSLGLGCLVLADDGLRRLIHGPSRNALLSMFFVAESLVWGTFGQYGGKAFLYGVYIFHIAAGSYFHYLGSYFAAFAKSSGRDRWLDLGHVALINGVLIFAGIAIVNCPQLGWLRPLFGVEWFTYWVAAHLVLSDVFPFLKRRLVQQTA